MKLEFFSKANNALNGTLPTISLGRAGCVRFNPAAMAHLGLQPDGMVAIGQDNDEESETHADWYVCAVQAGGFKLRDTKKTPTSVAFNSAALVGAILDSLNLDEELEAQKTLRFRLAPEPTVVYGINYYAILTGVIL
jgi:hypothetical protein